MMDNTAEQVLNSLRSQRDHLGKKIIELQDLQLSLDNVIAHYETSSSAPIKELTGGKQKIQLTAFIRKLFDANPTMKFQQSMIVAEVKLHKDEIETSSKNISSNVYTVLRRLVKSGENERGGTRKQRWYRKRQNVTTE